MKQQLHPRVAHLTSCHPPFDIRIFFKECVTLASSGWEISLVAPADTDTTREGVSIRAFPKARSRFERFFLTGRRVCNTAAALNASVWHVHDPDLLLWCRLSRHRPTIIIYDMHENMPKAVLTKAWLPALLRPVIAHLVRGIERLLARDMAVIFAESSYAKDYPWVQKSRIVRNFPIWQELAKIQETRFERPTIGYLGGVSRERGTFTTLEALAILKREGLEVDWVCIGPCSKEHTDELAERASALGIRHNVQVHGYQEPREAWKLIARCHAGLAVLAPVPNYYESYPTKIFEYMGLGLPVIVSDFPINRAVVDQAACGICVDPADPTILAQAIREILTNPALAERMSANGKREVQNRYCWEKEKGELLDFYDEICKQR